MQTPAHAQRREVAAVQLRKVAATILIPFGDREPECLATLQAPPAATCSFAYLMRTPYLGGIPAAPVRLGGAAKLIVADPLRAPCDLPEAVNRQALSLPDRLHGIRRLQQRRRRARVEPCNPTAQSPYLQPAFPQVLTSFRSLMSSSPRAEGRGRAAHCGASGPWNCKPGATKCDFGRAGFSWISVTSPRSLNTNTAYRSGLCMEIAKDTGILGPSRNGTTLVPQPIPKRIGCRRESARMALQPESLSRRRRLRPPFGLVCSA